MKWPILRSRRLDRELPAVLAASLRIDAQLIEILRVAPSQQLPSLRTVSQL
jgi:hypothetical protein